MCVLCCFALFVCLTLLASFFLPSHLSFKNMYIYAYVIQLEEGWICVCNTTRRGLEQDGSYGEVIATGRSSG